MWKEVRTDGLQWLALAMILWPLDGSWAGPSDDCEILKISALLRWSLPFIFSPLASPWNFYVLICFSKKTLAVCLKILSLEVVEGWDEATLLQHISMLTWGCPAPWLSWLGRWWGTGRTPTLDSAPAVLIVFQEHREHLTWVVAWSQRHGWFPR